MKVILNADVKHLGEEGDVKTVASGYARNYLFPRNLALPHNDATLAYFESRKDEILAKKEAKRIASASLQEKLAAHILTITMPAGPNGKLYGAVTSQTIADALNKDGFEIERKRIDVPGLTIKNTGKYTLTVRLYESASAELSLVVEAQAETSKAETSSKSGKGRRADKKDLAPDTEPTPAVNKEAAEKQKAE